MTVDPKKEIEPDKTPSADGGGGGRGTGSEGRGDRTRGSRRGGKNRARGESRGRNNNISNKSTNTIPRPTFKGDCTAIEDAIFDCSNPQQSAGYDGSIKHIANYVVSTYKESGDIPASLKIWRCRTWTHPKTWRTTRRRWRRESGTTSTRRTWTVRRPCARIARSFSPCFWVSALRR